MKKIAYLILAHADPKHFEKLVNAINYNARFFIHLDAKSDIKKFEQLSLPGDLVFIKDRVRVSWGSISMVDATLNLMQEALNSGEDFTHLVLLSGADYPMQSNPVIYDTFARNPQHEFIKYIDMRQSAHYIKQIKQKWFKEQLFHTSNKFLRNCDKTIRQLANKLQLHNRWDNAVVPYFGSQWWAFTPGCANYILKYVKDQPEYYNNNKHSFSPDEHFFHTVVGNSPYSEKCDGLLPYEGRGTWRTANLHIIHHSLTKWYTIDDWDEIKSSDKLFIRKVNSTVSGELIDLIDKKISGDR